MYPALKARAIDDLLGKYRFTYSLFSCVPGDGCGTLRLPDGQGMSNLKWIGITITFCNQKIQINDKRQHRTNGN